MKPWRIAAIVVGALLVLPALVLVVGGAALIGGYATQRDDDGYFDATLDRLLHGIALYGAETFWLLHMLACYRRRERSHLGDTTH